MSIKNEAKVLQIELTQVQKDMRSIRTRIKEFLLKLPQRQHDAIAAKDETFWRKLNRYFGTDISMTRLQKVLTIIAGDK